MALNSKARKRRKKCQPTVIEFLLRSLEKNMAAINDLNAAVLALQNEVITIVDILKSRDEVAIAAAAQAVNDEVAKLKAAE